MPRWLLVLNVVLGIASIVLIAGVVRTLVATRPLPAPALARVATTAPPAVVSGGADPGLPAYAVIAARNLFNPGRSETATAAAAAPVAKPILHGVVVDGTKSRAFLEEPGLKRVVGYSVGDMIGGGRIQEITDNKVVIARPEGGLLEVLLQDPSKPRVTTVGAPPGQQPPAAAVAPGQQPPGAAVAPVPTPSFPAPPQLRRRVPVQGAPGFE
jgi:type II secretion system (T2SS) protein C